MPAVHDTRLLSNLLKAEKEAQKSFKEYTSNAGTASAALSAWSTADSADTQDLMDVSARLAELVGAVLESQRNYLHALTAYRTSLKDILKRETELKTVIRDREILVNRVIKLGNKKPGDNAFDQHQLKLEDAQRELSACEQFLQEEEYALQGVKRRTFREALSMKIKAMEEMGHVMASTSAQSVQVLSQLVIQDGYPQFDHHHPYEDENGARSGSSMSLYSDQVVQQSRSISPVPRPNLADTAGKRQSQATITRAAPILPPPPSAPRLHADSDVAMTVPKAPAHVMTRRQANDDSSDDEEDGLVGPVPQAPPPASARPGLLHRRMNSDASSSVAAGSRAGSGARTLQRKRRGSFFGSIASFFRGGSSSSAQRNKDLSSSTTSGRNYAGTVWDTRTNSNLNRQNQQREREALANASRFRPSNDSSDEEGAMPKNLVRVVNDPKARVKALSDIGTGAKSVPPKRSSTALGGGGAAPSVKSKVSTKKRPEKALSDAGIGMRSTRPIVSVGTTARDAASVTSEGSTAKAKSTKKKKAKSGTIAEEPAGSGDKMVTTVIQTNLPPGSTLMNAPTDLRAPKLSRSNTARTNATTTTTGTKKKKVSSKKETAPPVPPTAEDLASALPSAKSNHAYTWEKEMETAKDIERRTGTAPSLPTEAGAAAESVLLKRSPSTATSTLTKKKKKKASSTVRAADQVQEGDVSLMSVVEGDPATKSTSRTYATKERNSNNLLAVPAAADLSRSMSQGSATPSLAKRKSVRLSTYVDPSAEQQQASSTPSQTGSATAADGSIARSTSPTPQKGILRTTTPASPAAALAAGQSTWQTRRANGTAAVLGAADVDSSDESDDGYRKFREELARGEKEFRNAMAGKWTKEEKGKSKAA